MFLDFYFLFYFFQPPSPQSPTDHPHTATPPPIQYTSLQIVSSLTIHPFINQLMSNDIVFLTQKNSSTVSSLSSTSPSAYVIYGTICIPTQNQRVNRLTINVASYLVGPTPFPRIAPLPVPPPPPPCHSGSSFCLSKTHQSHPSTTPSHPFPPY